MGVFVDLREADDWLYDLYLELEVIDPNDLLVDQTLELAQDLLVGPHTQHLLPHVDQVPAVYLRDCLNLFDDLVELEQSLVQSVIGLFYYLFI